MYLLMMFLTAHIFGFIGLPFFFDDHSIRRPKSVVIFEYLILGAVIYFEIVTLIAFVHHTIDRNIGSKVSRFYLRNMQTMAGSLAIMNVLFYVLLVLMTKRLTVQHYAVWGTRLTIVLCLLGFQYIKSCELLSVTKKELEADEAEEAKADEETGKVTKAEVEAVEENEEEEAEEECEEGEEEEDGEEGEEEQGDDAVEESPNKRQVVISVK